VYVDVALRIRNGGVERRAASLGPLTVLVELRDEWLFAKLIEHDREPLGTARVDVRPFNIYVNAARLLIKSLQPQPAHDKAAKPILIFGFSSMGREALLHILRAAPAPLGHANQIVVFDRDAELQGQRFHATFPMLAGDAAVEFVTLDAEADTPAAWQLVEERMRTAPPLMVAVCLPDDRASLFVALEVRVRLDKLGQFNVPVFVHLEQHQCLGTFAAEIERMEPYQDRLRAFGSLEDMLTPDILVGAQLDKLAEAFHQNYLASRPAGSAANAGARPWRELPEQYKVSNRRTADHTAVKLAQAGFRIEASASPKRLEVTVEEIELLARLEHRLWIIERRMLGWNYGATRDDGRRLNPNLIEWERLPEEMRGYNREATQAIPKILAAAGLEIRRNVQ
jgi:hypothetical protein